MWQNNERSTLRITIIGLCVNEIPGFRSSKRATHTHRDYKNQYIQRIIQNDANTQRVSTATAAVKAFFININIYFINEHIYT